MNRVKYTLLSASMLLALAFTFSCSSDDGGGDGGGGGASEGQIWMYDIESITESSFIIADKSYRCQENGILEQRTDEGYGYSYSINGKTLSFWGVDFNGNSTSLIGTWTREPFSADCNRNNDCDRYNGFSKAVFTQNSLTITECWGEAGEVRELENGELIMKIIDCGTVEYTRETETIRIKFSKTETTFTYNGKTCKKKSEYSKPQMKSACSEAYNNGEDYYEILQKDYYKCRKDNSFPKWGE